LNSPAEEEEGVDSCGKTGRQARQFVRKWLGKAVAIHGSIKGKDQLPVKRGG